MVSYLLRQKVQPKKLETLDRIKKYVSEEFLEKIIESILSNEKQIKEWKDLFGFDIKTKKDLIGKNRLDGFEYKKLPIDTKYFDEIFLFHIDMQIYVPSYELQHQIYLMLLDLLWDMHLVKKAAIPFLVPILLTKIHQKIHCTF